MNVELPAIRVSIEGPGVQTTSLELTDIKTETFDGISAGAKTGHTSVATGATLAGFTVVATDDNGESAIKTLMVSSNIFPFLGGVGRTGNFAKITSSEFSATFSVAVSFVGFAVTGAPVRSSDVVC